MSAKILDIDPANERLIHPERAKKRQFSEAHLKLSGNTLTLEVKEVEAADAEERKKDKQREGNRRRQNTFVEGKEKAGFRKTWIHKSVERLGAELNGQENIATEIKWLRARAEAAEMVAAAERKRADAAEAEVLRLSARSWWRFWR
ncbi:hypothetical protein DSM110093_02346 [Sulfitobacter sp. DSM 110093]|uniref:hypothetical protein n=1 Tax=Sulfitobacter sp. DSM 110093 TaxID=2883127 RepID=UPI001FABC0CC|nr:hypothetical protein [Sulfitobacter sp. DSM 110093]UOA32546.1 hypothetical protein DSM110093_02346 [Sulfitobacter sp. DSM 110093]